MVALVRILRRLVYVIHLDQNTEMGLDLVLPESSLCIFFYSKLGLFVY